MPPFSRLTLALAATFLGCAPVDKTAEPMLPSPPGLVELIAPFTKSLDISPKDFSINKGVYIQDIQIGPGPQIIEADEAAIGYTGWLPSGTIFDTNMHPQADSIKPYHFILGFHGVIPGLEAGMRGMKVGGIRRILIPAPLGYGPRRQGKIPANSTLLFEVKLLGLRNRDALPAPSL